MSIKDMLDRFKMSKPEAWVGGGVAVMAGSAIYGMVKAYNLKDELRDINKDISYAAEKKEKADTDSDKKDASKALRTAKIRKGLAIATTFGPAIAGEAIGAGMIFKGTKMLRKETIALAAAYASVDGAFRAYRGRVADKYGEETEKELYYGMDKKTIEVTETDENGKEKKSKIKAYTIGDENDLSPYARIFAYGESLAAEKNDEYNEAFIMGTWQTLDRAFKAKGFLFLNEFYEEYGYKPTIAGQAVGWVYDKDSDTHGDNRVDINLQTVWRKDEMGKYEKVYILDPNVDGDIRSHLLKIGLIDEQ